MVFLFELKDKKGIIEINDTSNGYIHFTRGERADILIVTAWKRDFHTEDLNL